MDTKQHGLTLLISFLILTLSIRSGIASLGYEGINYCSPLGADRSPHYESLMRKVIGRYGDYRKSRLTGHKHAGIDIRGEFSEPVFSIGQGVVTNIFRDFPHKTIYIRHQGTRGTYFYSVYIHVKDIKVHVSQRVTENTMVGRLFNPQEMELSNFGTPPHLHFEIRHSIDDNGDATFRCMSMRELNNYCMDPMMFFKKGFNN